MLEIEYTNEYTKHGCKIYGNVGVIRYFHLCNHGFNSAHNDGGIYDWIDKAKILAKQKHPNYELQLSIPDLVFTYYE